MTYRYMQSNEYLTLCKKKIFDQINEIKKPFTKGFLFATLYKPRWEMANPQNRRGAKSKLEKETDQ